MNDTDSKSSVIVGIDGSDTAIEAALWAIDEAVSRSVPLRLVCVTKAEHPSAEDYYADIHHAEDSLRAAQAAVDATGKSVKVETGILTGLPGVSLVEESYDATLVCIGSVGIGRYARSILGSTAIEVAEKAHCPVAIIRPFDTEADHSVNWITVADKRSRDTDALLEAAMDEAALRQAPVLVVGKNGSVERDVEALRKRHPGLRIYPIGDSADIARFLKNSDERVQLAVISGAEAHQVADILGPYGHHRFSHAGSSVLVVRGRLVAREEIVR
ncbi:universal stress protein [Mycobacterium sp. 852002-51961_SCH5331710]|nr:universal stress protein [Mycobacterium sp. E136]OBB37333.1 universal stress protein [Mycobacterium sp. 852002-51961_SCH5331710]OBH01803.1 universal stress protein [Mycobacterium sp. E136]